MDKLTEQPEVLLAEKRYEAISKIVSATLRKGKETWTTGDMLDHVFLHKYLGIPIFLVLLWALFIFTFTFSEPFMVMIELLFGWLGGLAESGIANPHAASFVAGGLCDGLGSVLVFVPPIFALFLGLAILEHSGYMARAAFAMDGLMYRVGLHGRSFMPMICGFGCNVPAVMATRSIEDKKDRTLTILVNPLMSCGARLPVYVLIAGVIFAPAFAGTAVFAMYALGIALALMMAFLFRRTILKGRPSPFILEFPTYMVPPAKSVLSLMWVRGKWFIIRAGTIIFIGVIIVWALTAHGPAGFLEESTKEIRNETITAEGVFVGNGTFTGEGVFTGVILANVTIGDENYKAGQNVTELRTGEGEKIEGNGTFESAEGCPTEFAGNGTYTGDAFLIEESYVASLGKTMEPVFRPFGWDWMAGVALTFGFLAKEIVVGTYGTLLGAEEEATGEALVERGIFTPASGFAFMAFTLIYVPCVATIAVVARETRSWKWTLFVVGYLIGLAFLVSAIIVGIGYPAGLM